MATASKFADRINTYAASIPDKVNELKKGAVKAIVSEIIPSTPVLSGAARSNYVVGIGSPNRVVNVAPNIDREGSGALSAALEAIDTAKPGDDVYLSNNLPYIQELNDGSSKQQPAGFVERAVFEGQTYITSQVNLNTKANIDG